MNWPWIKRILIAAIVIPTLVWVGRQMFTSDADRLRKQITQMEHAVELGKILTLNDYIAADYTDNLGFDKRTVLAYILSLRQQHDAVLINISDMDFFVASDRATARVNLRAKVVSFNTKQLLQPEASSDRYQLDFRRDGRSWKLYHVEVLE
jgi:hypothetical protein